MQDHLPKPPAPAQRRPRRPPEAPMRETRPASWTEAPVWLARFEGGLCVAKHGPFPRDGAEHLLLALVCPDENARFGLVECEPATLPRPEHAAFVVLRRGGSVVRRLGPYGRREAEDIVEDLRRGQWPDGEEVAVVDAAS